MRRVLASLLVILMTFALVARGVAAPIIHLHLDVPAPLPSSSVSDHEHNHTGAHVTGMTVAADSENGGVAEPGNGDAKNKNTPIKNGKICDAHGPCCGPLALVDTSEGDFSREALPQPSHTIASVGVKPTNPDRPPSPLLA